MRHRNAIVVVALLTALFATATVAALNKKVENVSATVPTERIKGGEIAKRQPWAVMIKSPGGVCTGIAFKSSYILTARHCAANRAGDAYLASSIYVRYGTDYNNHPGDTEYVGVVYLAPVGDIAILRLSADHPLSTYPQLDLAYAPPEDNRRITGFIYGYGSHDGVVPADPSALYDAEIFVVGPTTNWLDDDAISVEGVDGITREGDSGGPLFVGGRIVGIASTGDNSNDNRAIYSNLRQARAWFLSIDSETPCSGLIPNTLGPKNPWACLDALYPKNIP